MGILYFPDTKTHTKTEHHHYKNAPPSAPAIDEAIAATLSTSLSLNGIRLGGAPGVRHLLRALEVAGGRANVTRLNLYGTGIGPGGAKALADALASAGCPLGGITEINLDRCNLQDGGAAHVARTMALVHSLRRITVAHNRLTSRGLDTLLAALQRSPHIRYLGCYSDTSQRLRVGGFINRCTEVPRPARVAIAAFLKSTARICDSSLGFVERVIREELLPGFASDMDSPRHSTLLSLALRRETGRPEDVLAVVCKIALLIGSRDLFEVAFLAGGDVALSQAAGEFAARYLGSRHRVPAWRRGVPSLRDLAFRASRRSLLLGEGRLALSGLQRLGGSKPAWVIAALSYGLVGDGRLEWGDPEPLSTADDYFISLKICLKGED